MSFIIGNYSFYNTNSLVMNSMIMNNCLIRSSPTQSIEDCTILIPFNCHSDCGKYNVDSLVHWNFLNLPRLLLELLHSITQRVWLFQVSYSLY